MTRSHESSGVDQDGIIAYIREAFAGVDVQRPTDGPGAGDTFFIYDPERNLPPQQHFPFATIVTKDYGEFDNASSLDRPGVFRLNIGIERETFRHLFGTDANAANYDFAALDRLMPHPVYAPQSFVCVLNPSEQTFQMLKPLLAEAYAIAQQRRQRRS